MIAFKSQKRQRDQQRKQKITENRKHLANVRVVQKNLVFVVGLPPRLADADVGWARVGRCKRLTLWLLQILKKHEYFGKYGKIHKVVINPSTTYAGVQVRVVRFNYLLTHIYSQTFTRWSVQRAPPIPELMSHLFLGWFPWELEQ